jgi:hypothetical protein
MSPFQFWGLIGAALWLAVTGLWFRRSTPVLIGGLVVIAAYAVLSMVLDRATVAELGLGPVSPAWTVAWAVGWLLVMLAASPVSDRIASALFKKPPTLGAFKALQQSRAKLIAGIALAWLLGGVLEELALRGLILRAVEASLPGLGVASSVLGAVAAAAGAWVLHLYQGQRAALIVSLLSLLFGALFVVSGHNLWAVMLCHGLYDTVAFIRFAMGKSKYAKPTD